MFGRATITLGTGPHSSFICTGIDVARGPEADTSRILFSEKSFLKRTTKRVELRNSFVFSEITVLRLVRYLYMHFQLWLQ